MANSNNNNFVTIEDGISNFTGGKVTSKKTINPMGIVWLAIGALMFVAQTFDKEDGALTMALFVMGLCAVAVWRNHAVCEKVALLLRRQVDEAAQVYV